ncbi:hypothetical protein ACLOJK_021768, partial [Asimina triloba]
LIRHLEQQPCIDEQEKARNAILLKSHSFDSSKICPGSAILIVLINVLLQCRRPARPKA